MVKSKYSILYAEDENNTRENYMACMEMFFENVYEAKNGEEALRKFELYNPDILILDIKMPYLNGLDVAKEIREKNSTTKIFILTAHSDNSILLDAVTLKLENYLIKPVSRDTLIKSFEKVIEELNLNAEDERILLNSEHNIEFDKKSELLYIENENISLTKYEREILKFFIKRKNTILSKDTIYNEVWENEEFEFKDENIRNLIKNLRKKLKVDMIESIYGSGYLMKI